jgi:GalNAc-alpha-(1->4)-GalNAc-alpha-(1->3)-diNAcBac-PP-undecaprenol alpha-1,4-N-acetyl-D-galactosaminyltransferase
MTNQKLTIIGPSMKMGGMERASVNLANALSKKGLEISFISFFKQEHFFKLDKTIHLIEPIGFNSNKLSLIKTIFWLRKSIQQLNPDNIIVFNKLYGAITCLSLINTNYKVFISERSSPLYQWPKWQAFLIDIIFGLVKPYGVISQTNIAKDFQKKYYGKKVNINVIPNALRPIVHNEEVKRRNVILCIGRLNDPLKGFDRILAAFAKVKKKDWTLEIAGGSQNEDPLLTKYILENNLTDNVKLLGKVSDIDSLLSSSSIFVIPSRSEGFPNSLCEAMAAGIACIAFDFIAGPRDLIEDGVNGILVNDGDIQGLANAIDYLIENPEVRKRLGRESEKIVEKLSSNIIANKTLEFLNERKYTSD